MRLFTAGIIVSAVVCFPPVSILASAKQPAEERAAVRVLITKWRFYEAEERVRDLLQQAEDVGDTQSIEYANTLDMLVLSLLWQEKTGEKCLESARRAVQMKENLVGPDSPLLAESLDNLGWLWLEKVDYERSRTSIERALAIRSKASPADSAGEASSLMGLANLQGREGKKKVSIATLERALALRKKALGPDHPDVALSMRALASCAANAGQYAKAERLFRSALSIQERALGSSEPAIAQTVHDIGFQLTKMHDWKGAKPLAERVVAIYEAVASPKLPGALEDLAVVLRELGDYDQARKADSRADALRHPMK